MILKNIIFLSHQQYIIISIKKKGFIMLELSFELMFAFFMLFVLFGLSFLPAQFFFTPYED